jgi:ligand-binding sensor domain-containing protein/signal transduction histidine kinase
MKYYFTSMLLFSIVVISCNSKQNEDLVTYEAEVKSNGFVNKDSLDPSVVNIITQANAPKIIPATKPELLPFPFKEKFSHFSFTNYSAANGILLKDVNSSYLDRKGNLWFSTSNGIQQYDGNSFINYTIKNGLINNNARVVLQDQKGNLWIRSNNGACKFDGTSFMNFTKETGLGDSKIRSMMMDKKGDVWIGTYGGGVSKYNDSKGFTTYTTADGLVNNAVRSIHEDRSGNLWFGTDSGLSKFNGKSFTNFTKKDGLVNEYVFQILEDKKGNFWFVAIGKGLLRYDGNSFTHFNEKYGLADATVFTIMEDRSGILWIGTDNGIIKYDGNTFLKINDRQKISDSRINYIKEDKKGNIWFGTDADGVIKYDGHSFQKITKADGLVSDLVYNIQEDQSGNIWLGTKDGITMISCQQLAISNINEDSDFGAFLFSDRLENYWFSTEKGIYMFNDSSFYDFTKVLGLKKEVVIEFLHDRKGNYWFRIHPFGIIKYDGKFITRYTEKQGLVGSEIYDIDEDSSGNIWIGTDKGLNMFDGRSFSYFSSAQGIIGAYVTVVFKDKSENLWFSTDAGLHRFNGTTFTYFDIKQLGFNNNYIFSISQDQSGNLWIGTDAGMIKYNGASFRGYTSKDGLVNDRIFEIKEDLINGMLWACTENGLSGLLLSEVNDSASTPRIENFNKQTGYNFGSIHSIIIDKKGILWMGMDKRLVRFNYASEKNKVPSTIQITNVSLNNENIIWHSINKNKAGSHERDSLAILNEMMKKMDKALSVKDLKIKTNKYKSVWFDSISSFYQVPQNLLLSHNYGTIGFDFAAVAPFSGREVLFQYKLDGYDKEWSDLSRKKSVLYGGLGSGKYTFRVKALNQSGAWSEISYPFKVLPPWWLTWWAFFFYILLLAFSFTAYSRFRSRKLRKENIKLEKKVIRRTSELKSSLEKLKATQTQLIHSEKMASLGQLTAGIAHEIRNPLNFVNNFSELSKELLDEMKNEMDKGNSDEVKAISNDLIHNLEKILHHGKRADGIVKGMLQHSRTGSGKKEYTDINALADELLRLANHGLRAKDKTLKVATKSDYDKSIGLVNIMPQDMGRVILNLISNAFYTVLERQKKGEPGFEPVVSVSTKKINDKIEVTVSDNGTGIPQTDMDKIFQPFFTTKPTGQGTGLGLSLSYDIVKAHGGALKVETIEGEGSTFIIHLPIV